MDFAQHTIDLARRNVEEGGRPFATVIVKDGEILAESPTWSPRPPTRPPTRKSSRSAGPAPPSAPNI